MHYLGVSKLSLARHFLGPRREGRELLFSLLKIPLSSLHDHMLPVQPQSGFASGKPLSLCGALTIEPLLIFWHHCWQGAASPPTHLVLERGSAVPGKGTNTNSSNPEISSNTLKENFAASNPGEPGSGFPGQGVVFQTAMISLDSNPIF